MYLMYYYTNVPMYHYTNVSMYLMYHYTNVLNVPLYQCTIIPMYQCTYSAYPAKCSLNNVTRNVLVRNTGSNFASNFANVSLKIIALTIPYIV